MAQPRLATVDELRDHLGFAPGVLTEDNAKLRLFLAAAEGYIVAHLGYDPHFRYGVENPRLDTLKLACLILAANYYEHRGATIGGDLRAAPFAVQGIIATFADVTLWANSPKPRNVWAPMLSSEDDAAAAEAFADLLLVIARGDATLVWTGPQEDSESAILGELWDAIARGSISAGSGPAPTAWAGLLDALQEGRLQLVWTDGTGGPTV